MKKVKGNDCREAYDNFCKDVLNVIRMQILNNEQ